MLPLDASAIEDHLTGRSTVGIYPMLDDEGFDDARLDTLFRAMPSCVGSNMKAHKLAGSFRWVQPKWCPRE